jgi:hypothetical protein
MFAFVGQVPPNKNAEFRRLTADLNGSRKKEYEDSRKKAGFRQEAMFLQKTPVGDMVVLIQDAESEQAALDSLRGMTDPFHVWYFEQMKDLHGIDLTGPATPQNELLLDYRSED